MKPTYDEIEAITESFDESGRVLPCQCWEVQGPLPAKDNVMTQTRLLRAAADQCCSDASTLSRYQIWAETLRGALMSVIDDVDRGQSDEHTRRNLVRVTNSIAAFCEIQRLFVQRQHETVD